MARWRRSAALTAPRWELGPDGQWYMLPLPSHADRANVVTMSRRTKHLAGRLPGRIVGGVAGMGLVGGAIATGNWLIFGTLGILVCLAAALAPPKPDHDPPGGSYGPPPPPPQLGGFDGGGSW